MSKTMNVGIIGCGNISNAYFKACKRFTDLALVACADLDLARAQAQAKEHAVAKAYTVDQLLADPSIQLVVNLTIPKAHAEIDCKALEAGKHVFSEKPFAITRAEGQRVVDLAKKRNLRVGCAPDTVLGAGVQTARKLIDDGAIGKPVAVNAFMMGPGHESWHPSPEFYYQKGGGPMFDMGPYYLHALITLLGPVRRVTGVTRVTVPERTITSEPKKGTKVTVEVPTHISSILDFAGGAVGTLITSFDVKSHTLPHIEIYGSEGSMQVPDPNGTGGPVRVKRVGEKEWQELPLTHHYREGSRGLGVADMARAIASGRKHRANEEIALHALDIMQAIHESSDDGRHVTLGSTCQRPQAMSTAVPEFTLDD
ncbi:MAG: Gfo/Idh/MocA family oxidoreductase [Planctomycetes bacterium]|nr:Gfo/Idh/MocA family oxidoreductase [Planctomycetota bacterium]